MRLGTHTCTVIPVQLQNALDTVILIHTLFGNWDTFPDPQYQRHAQPRFGLSFYITCMRTAAA